MTAALIVFALTGALGVFAKSTVFSAGAAAVRPASPGPDTAAWWRPSRGRR